MGRDPAFPKVRQPDWDSRIRAARRRNRLIERRANRLQLYMLAIFAALAAAYLLDRAAAGITTCAIERPAQCPEVLK